MKKVHISLLSVIAVILLTLTFASVFQRQDTRSRASENFSVNAGRPFADTSAWNEPIGTNVRVDPNSAAIVSKLASGKQSAALYEFGTPVFFATTATQRYQIDCTMPWGPCGLEGQQVPIPDEARPAPGSDGQMVVVDLTNRKSYEFWQYKNDKATTSWGATLPLDGDGRGTAQNHAVGAGTSRLAGVVRTYEIEQGVIDHALVFSSKYCQGPNNGTNFRPPAIKTDGKYIGEGAIPEGARVQLDPTVNVDAIAGVSKGEKAVAKALQKYGAYAIDCGGAEMAFSFENPIGKADPYPAAGFGNDYFEFDKIPWDKLRVLEAWNSYTPATAGGGSPATSVSPTSMQPTLITPTIYCLGGVPCFSPAPTTGTTTTPPVGGANPTTDPNVTGTTNPNPTINPCETQSSIQTKKHKKHKKTKRGGGGWLSKFFDFLIKLIMMLFGMSVPPTPVDPNPVPTPSPVEPTPCPEPTTGEQPTTEPQPTTAPEPTSGPSVEPTTSIAPSTVTPSL